MSMRVEGEKKKEEVRKEKEKKYMKIMIIMRERGM